MRAGVLRLLAAIVPAPNDPPRMNHDGPYRNLVLGRRKAREFNRLLHPLTV